MVSVSLEGILNLTPTAGEPNRTAVTIIDAYTGPRMGFAGRLISANPPIDSNDPGYICHVANAVNWLRAIAGNASVNAIVGF